MFKNLVVCLFSLTNALMYENIIPFMFDMNVMLSIILRGKFISNDHARCFAMMLKN